MTTLRAMLAILGLACAVNSPAIAGETAEEVAHKMTVIANPPYREARALLSKDELIDSERANVEKRFAFVLSAMV